MVMDATPSPQSVGREFVRQYYTLLNKAPNHLHRFYNNHSSFVHGGLDQHNREAAIVVGQKNIHNRIQQLNFRDCHAKISQVDSQATLGDGVVVQVTGELSNDGQPMRRFTQTFVLAAQSPKKYYVHNDIFRYQDFYSDEEVDGESGARSENDEEYQDAENLEAANALQQPAQIFYPISGVVPPTAAVQTVPIQPFTQAPQLNGVVHEDVLQGIQPQGNVINIPVAPVAIQPIPPQQTTQQPQEVTIPMEPITVAAPINIPSNIPTNIPEPQDIIETIVPVKQQNETIIIQEAVTIIEKEPQQEIPNVIEKIEIKDEPKIVASEPKTYANLVKSGVTGFSFATMASSSSSIVSGNSSRQNTLSPPPSRYQQSDSRKSDVDNTGSGPMPQRSNNRSQNRERRSSNANNQNFGDSHQLFIGNVPHHATEDELRALFSKFGIVADLRIHSKVGPKVPGGRAPPNYGFITYENPESVQNCLTNTPLYYPDNSPDGQKLNIEEKKRISNNMRGNNGPPTRQGGNPGGLGGGNPATNRGGISNQGPPRGGPSSRGGGGGGRGGFNSNRTERGGTSATRTGGGGSGGGGGGASGGNAGTLNYTRRQ